MVNFGVREVLAGAVLVLSLQAAYAQGPPASSAAAASHSPEIVLRNLVDVLMKDLRSDKDLARGDPGRMREVFDKKGVMHVDMAGMTEATVGSSRWQRMSTMNRRELIEQYYQLVIVQYASHLSRIDTSKSVPIATKTSTPTSVELEARFETKEGTAPILYRLRVVDGTWKITDIAVLGVWFVPLFRGQFDGAIKRGGIDGLITELVAKNQGRASARIEKER